ncbi:hypothetical protein ACLOJK_010341 [Asimina triloba]
MRRVLMTLYRGTTMAGARCDAERSKAGKSSLLLVQIGNIVPEIDDCRSDGHDQRLGCMEGPNFAYEEEDLIAMEMTDFQMDFRRFLDGHSSVSSYATAAMAEIGEEDEVLNVVL